VPVCPAGRCCVCARPGCRRPRRYPFDTTDGEWALLAPLLPVPACQTRTGGRPEANCRRAAMDAIRYVIHNGCVWRALPADFPPWRTVYGIYQRWNASGATIALHDALRGQARRAVGRATEPTAAVIDSQSVRAADTVARASRGWDNGKKVNGRKRHIAVDVLGGAAGGRGHSRVGAGSRRGPAAAVAASYRRIQLVWADAGYAGKLVAWAHTTLHLAIEVVRKRDAHTFEVLPRRWVVERTFAWISKHRRCVRDYERLPEHHEAMIKWAMIALMARRLARQIPAAQPARAAMAAAA
jgi:transposase